LAIDGTLYALFGPSDTVFKFLNVPGQSARVGRWGVTGNPDSQFDSLITLIGGGSQPREFLPIQLVQPELGTTQSKEASMRGKLGDFSPNLLTPFTFSSW
jgi:hypothetical protein